MLTTVVMLEILDDSELKPSLIHQKRQHIGDKVLRILIRLHTLNGDSAGALRAYHDCLMMLKRELGVEPDAQATAVYQDVLTWRSFLKIGLAVSVQFVKCRPGRCLVLRLGMRNTRQLWLGLLMEPDLDLTNL